MSEERPSICATCPLAKPWVTEDRITSERYLICGWQPKVLPLWWHPDAHRVPAMRIRPKSIASWRGEERCDAKAEEEERLRRIREAAERREAKEPCPICGPDRTCGQC